MPPYAFYDLTGVVKAQLAEGLSLSVLGLYSNDRLRLERDADRKELVCWDSWSAAARLLYSKGGNVWEWKVWGRHAGMDTDLKKNVRMNAETGRNTWASEWAYRSYRGERWRWETGVRAEYARWRYAGLEQWDLEDSEYVLLTGYAQGTWSAGGGWMLQGGVNYQYYHGKYF